jgi:hypothetical protein
VLPGVSEQRELLEARPSRDRADAEQARRLVEGLADAVVEGGAEYGVLP